ncbi:hypothetical protein G3I01_02880 [Gramella sp. MT6]|uniref:hypothetical protein n=1 Tax=Gramella sp. MT6 TaxID=2705471 RepID=UPI001C5DA212|nr:hypothetical protein [Gramella sp. MT6]QYA24495.1 hypothetical protein G3I01_02880 [Gramella sp. MT6]
MNKVRIGGLGMIITGVLIGYFFNRIDIHLLSGMLIGVGVGWLITGRLLSSPTPQKSTIKSK